MTQETERMERLADRWRRRMLELVGDGTRSGSPRSATPTPPARAGSVPMTTWR